MQVIKRTVDVYEVVPDNQIDKLEAYCKIMESKGKFFTVYFYKKDGSFRQLTGRLHVQKGVTGKGLKYVPLEKRLICVYDVQACGFRMVSLKTIIGLRINGQKWNVV